MLKGKKILVSGACGYIGSHTVVDLLEKGADVLAVDNLSNASKNVLERIKEITGIMPDFIELDLSKKDKTLHVLDTFDAIDGIIHFAALKSVGDSVKHPLKYYDNNLNALISLCEWAEHKEVSAFVFSSSCSVYGNSSVQPVTEMTPWGKSESPYATTKQMGEQILADWVKISKRCNLALLRYFNPAGAHHSGLLGEHPNDPPNNLVPVICEVAAGKRDCLQIFGADYNTADGTCVRDYVHVMDIARAHTQALIQLFSQGASGKTALYNLGSGVGRTVLEIVAHFESVNNCKIPCKIVDRRPGDVEVVYADISRARYELDWEPLLGITEILQSAFVWERNKIKYA
jgi:UDP-glucose 4-epimerase